MTSDGAGQQAAAAGKVGSALEDVLAHRRWVRRGAPVPHVVAQNVFVPRVYEPLAAHFAGLLREHPEAFRRDMAGYDAAGAGLDRHRGGPLELFLRRDWHDLIAGVTGVAGTGDVSASLHHHQPGSAAGWPHNDLNPGWFPADPPPADRVQVPADGPVSYHHGTRPDGVGARETVRAVAVLFYLANPPWQRGDGGETALLASGDRGRGPATLVPPLNNSLVLFECTPHSWHAFCANPRTPRNSLVMWLHRPKPDVVTRWGEHSIVRW
jgi:hypothetical protein